MFEQNKTLFQNLRNLNLPSGEYAIFGSGPMGVRNLREMHDIDIIVTETLFNEYLNKAGWKIRKIYENNDCFEGLDNHDLNIEMWKDWYTGWNVFKMIQESEIIDDMPFVKLSYLIKWKKFFATNKDITDIEIIEHYLEGLTPPQH